MRGIDKVKIVWFIDGDTLAEEIWTVEQLVMGKHLEWMKEMHEEQPEADWRMARP